MHCPSCSFDDTKVIDSRLSEEGGAIRRRRSCTQCGYRFTTYERLEEVALNVLKRGGGKQPFDRRKMMAGIQAAVKGRPVGDEMIMEIAERIEDALRLEGGDVTSNQVGHAVLEQLRLIDEVAYMRFASVYKNFDDATDFKRELALLKKHTSTSRV
ncbi:MAG: transcriptional regulator NrdR [Ilumatobacteraceae bacterium]|jgi:transcriptional repressor NrdR|nr:MAG: NrdR family transcriptional regulator [Acidimicrobiia bacterium BACL6 MAG-120910-bin40]KRO56597.1 MAG: NrdR family transcriptional regulator [Acidimicrobiia bacterium BACL6 MAG-120322-bin79]